MSTKAGRARTTARRDANPSKPEHAPRSRRDVLVDTSQPGVSTIDRKAGGGSTAARRAAPIEALACALEGNRTDTKPARSCERA